MSPEGGGGWKVGKEVMRRTVSRRQGGRFGEARGDGGQRNDEGKSRKGVVQGSRDTQRDRDTEWTQRQWAAGTGHRDRAQQGRDTKTEGGRDGTQRERDEGTEQGTRECSRDRERTD